MCKQFEPIAMNSWSQMQGGQNWILPIEINANQFFWDSRWLEIWKNQLCPFMGPNGGSAASASELHYACFSIHGIMESLSGYGLGFFLWPIFLQIYSLFDVKICTKSMNRINKVFVFSSVWRADGGFDPGTRNACCSYFHRNSTTLQPCRPS